MQFYFYNILVCMASFPNHKNMLRDKVKKLYIQYIIHGETIFRRLLHNSASYAIAFSVMKPCLHLFLPIQVIFQTF